MLLGLLAGLIVLGIILFFYFWSIEKSRFYDKFKLKKEI